jgi:Concanavalin A-like lectin/glucanases superfamily
MDARPDAARRSRSARRKILGVGGLTAVVALTLAGAGLAWAGFQGQLANSTGTFSTGTLLLGGVTPVGVSCTSSSTVAPISTNSATCPGDPLPTGTLSTAGSAATSTLSDPGTTDPTAAAMSSPTCGVAQLTDDESNDMGLAMGGVTYGQSGPLGGTGIALDGSNGWFESTAPYSTPGSFTVLAWFKAAPGASGTIFSLSSSQFDTGSPASDLDLWVDGSGQLVWGVVTLTALGDPLPSETTSTGTVTDGSWHLAAATFSGLSSTLYLDGTVQGTVPALSGVASETGWYPAIGWGPEGAPTWLDGPPSGFFAGTLAMVSLSPSAATGAQVSALAASGSTAAYESALSSDAPPTENWEMADSGTQAFTGAVAVSSGGTTVPCQRVEAAVQEVEAGTTSCVLPAGPGACPAPTPTTVLSSLINMAPLVAPTTTSPAQLTVTLALTAASPPGVAGLDLLPGLDFGVSRTGWSANLIYAGATVEM